MAAASTKTEDEKAAAKEASYANGFRKVREEKGYGRVAAAEALEVTTSALWKMEHTEDPKEIAAALKAIKALPQAPKVERKKAEPKAKATAVAGKKAPAKPKAKPAEATDLI